MEAGMVGETRAARTVLQRELKGNKSFCNENVGSCLLVVWLDKDMSLLQITEKLVCMPIYSVETICMPIYSDRNYMYANLF